MGGACVSSEAALVLPWPSCLPCCWQLQSTGVVSAKFNYIPTPSNNVGEGSDNLLQYSCLGNPMDKGVWQVTVHGVTKSRT